jgi:hypothetical protein
MIETVATGAAGGGGSTEGIRPLGRKGDSNDNALQANAGMDRAVR